jgi:hypothetical protein
VNRVSEQDLELLEDCLDGELSPGESERLHARLEKEPELAEVLDELRGERAARSAVWASLEPSEGHANRFAERVIATAKRQERKSRFWQVGRFGSAAAACLVLGVFLGWIGRDRGITNYPGPTAPINPHIVVAPAAPMPAPAAQSLGVLVSEIQVQSSSRPPRPMLIVSEVTTPAVAPGVGLEVGDLLLSVDGERVPNVATLAAVLARRPGIRVLSIVRDGEVRDLRVQFQSR